jgi:hypothetical protein
MRTINDNFEGQVFDLSYGVLLISKWTHRMHLKCFLIATIKKQVTACIKVSHDDKFGTPCMPKGIMRNTHLFQPHYQVLMAVEMIML